MNRPKAPSDRSRDELVGLVEGLVEMTYGDTDDSGLPVWAPEMPVVGGDLVEWAEEEVSRLDLVLVAGPQR